MKIAELERVSGVPRSTIHHYLNLGLLNRPRTAGPKLHLFDEEHVKRLDEIRKLRGRGLPLSRIRERLAHSAPRTRVKRAKPADRGSTRGQIIEQATLLFAARGFQGVRLVDVARALGIGKATIYRHFSNKEALFVECVERVRFTLVPKALRDSAERSNLEDQGRGRARAVLEHFEAYRALTHFLAAMAHDSDPAIAARAKAERHGMITNAEPFLRKLLSARGRNTENSELMAYMLWGALIGAGERMTLDERHTLDHVLETYLEFVTFGLYGAAAG